MVYSRMADIFISYSKQHAQLTEDLARDLEAEGYTTWWDTSLLPDDVFFPETIRTEIKAAKVVIVIWTEHAVTSRWVYSEATEGDEQGKLLQVRDAALDIRLVPMPFKAGNISLVTDRAKVFATLARRGRPRRRLASKPKGGSRSTRRYSQTRTGAGSCRGRARRSGSETLRPGLRWSLYLPASS
jgi:hypothetical protein